MRLGYRTQGFVLGSGERYCLLVDPDSGMPLFYPNLFVTTQVRNRSLSVASMDAASAAINVLLTYCTERGIDLESRIRARRFFNPAELDAIRDECQRRWSKHGGPAVVPFRRRKARQRIGAGSEYARLTHIANYLRWLSHTLLGFTVDESTARQIDLVHRGLIGRRPVGKRSAAVKCGPTPEQVVTLQEVVDPTAGHAASTAPLAWVEKPLDGRQGVAARPRERNGVTAPAGHGSTDNVSMMQNPHQGDRALLIPGAHSAHHSAPSHVDERASVTG
ncbi:hypothetical protein SAMN04487785_101161 [Dyella jiangningensis]|nr:hypothetical protein BDW41_103410 [Dyella sp. AtDHG13]SDJ19537.1 hypothetical protein SAMN04487785_101161 [Dyella jiangningensis]